MSTFGNRVLRNSMPVAAAGCMALFDGSSKSTPDLRSTKSRGRQSSPLLSLYLQRSAPSMTLMESAKAYEHDIHDFDYYVRHPTTDDLPELLHRFDQQGQEVWPWIWTHPNENGPHHVFIGKNITPGIVNQIQELRRLSPQNNILICISDDASALHEVVRKSGAGPNVLDNCHCGVVTGVNLELLNFKHKILMLDDERVIAFDYLTIC